MLKVNLCAKIEKTDMQLILQQRNCSNKYYEVTVECSVTIQNDDVTI